MSVCAHVLVCVSVCVCVCVCGCVCVLGHLEVAQALPCDYLLQLKKVVSCIASGLVIFLYGCVCEYL